MTSKKYITQSGIEKETERFIQTRKNEAERKREQFMSELRQQNPEYSEKEKQIKKTGAELVVLALDRANTQKYESAKKEFEVLVAEKNELLEKAAGMTQKELADYGYFCPACHDTGIVPGGETPKRCSCYIAKKCSILQEYFGIRNENASFDAVDFSMISDEADEEKYKIKESPRAYMKKVVAFCEKFVEETAEYAQNGGEKPGNLRLYGRTGVGKSYICDAMEARLTEKNVPVICISSSGLYPKVFPGEFNSEMSDAQAGFRELLSNVDVLIIDDLGAEKMTETRLQDFLELLNARISNKKCVTVISTNLTSKDLNDYYGERIASRIIGCFKPVQIIGNDLRIK